MQSTITFPSRSVSTIAWFGHAGAYLRQVFSNKRNLVAFLILAPIITLAILAPVLPIADPLRPAPLESLQGPSLHHPFGTDKLGRDVFSRTLNGARVSLLIGFTAATISMVIGIVGGTLTSFMGRWVDGIAMGVLDVLLSFPSLLLALSIVAVFGAGIPQIILAIVTADAPRAIRLQRSLALGIKSRNFIDAARIVSAPTPWLLRRHVVPHTLGPMMVVASIFAANAILIEASLSFLGLGIVPPQPSWGNIINDGRPYLDTAWWISTFPGIALALVAIGLHVVSDGIRQNLDPRLLRG
jgi:peptide/nickel transport system permease protein